MLLAQRRESQRVGRQASHVEQEEPEDCLEGAEILAGLRFTSRESPWTVAPTSAPLKQAICSKPPSRGTRPRAAVQQPGVGSDEEQSDDEEYRPSKVRVIHNGASGAPIILPRRSYTWRGASRKQAQQQQQEEGAADSSASDASVPVPGVQPEQPSISCAGGSAVACSAAEASAAAAPMATSGGSSGTREGDKEWAALTTWLRMNLHNPRTAKKVVLFVGQKEAASGRWVFDLNPALTWADVSQDTKLRLRDLLGETQAAFRRKYPNRPSGDWSKKSQKYRAPGTSATHQVPLDHLVLSLHQMYQRFEGSAAPISSSGSHDSDQTAGPCPIAVPASPTASHNS
ncbi:hypothetical protein N2152v2_004232 [Parachlorella kessleri]